MGKHDGEVKGKRYFKCKPKHGVMLKPEQVTKLASKSSKDKKRFVIKRCIVPFQIACLSVYQSESDQ